MSTAKPLTHQQRLDRYAKQNGTTRLTPAQARRATKKNHKQQGKTA